MKKKSNDKPKIAGSDRASAVVRPTALSRSSSSIEVRALGKFSSPAPILVAGSAKGVGASPKSFPVVGVGASAGGLAAFTELLSHVAVDTGMAFVLVQHLDPDHESALTELLSRTTAMPVLEVTRRMRVKPNHIYVIPPGQLLTFSRGTLHLQTRPHTRRLPHSIDFLFESLAQDQKEKAIGVILSGTASDGTLGLEAIKAEGGITFAQDGSAKFDSMPRNAVAAGCVDFVLSPQAIAEELARVARHPYVQGAFDAAALEPASYPPKTKAGSRNGAPKNTGFSAILALLKNHFHVDFSSYKPSTIHRRITRRMVLSRCETIDAYARLLRDEKELAALFSDLLIGVTSFFRNADAFEALKTKAFAKLMNPQRADPVRVWIPGCSSGQEAYSVAIMLLEYFKHAAGSAPTLQIFGTDLNEAMLNKARHGLYPKNLAADLSPERLRRFFVEEEGGYRVNKLLRDACVFARHNLVGDPPFSRMDLICCRNLLIYLDAELQKKILPTFHYALKPGGVLFLGASESIGSLTDLFEPVDKKQKIYARKPSPARTLPLYFSSRHPGQAKKTGPAEAASSGGRALPGEISAEREADRLALRQYAPPSVLLDAGLRIIQFRGATGRYLEPSAGKAEFHVLKMARDGLMLPLRTAINQARKDQRPVRRKNVAISDRGETQLVTILVTPLKNLRERCYLVTFEDPVLHTFRGIISEKASASPGELPSKSTGKGVAQLRRQTRRIADLEHELAETRDYLQSLQQEHEAAHDELETSGEEVQSANEEFQSINEELETSKEELESTNEELITVNEEMMNRNTELTRLNTDLSNLHVSINTAIVVVGRDLTLWRFTAPAEKLFNLLPSDLGRLIGGIRHNLKCDDLEKTITEVIESGNVCEREVQDKTGHWYQLRIHPYTTLDYQITGAVLALVDIDELKRSEQEIKTARDYAESILRTTRDPLIILRADLRVKTTNEAFYRTFQTTRADTEGRAFFELGNGQWKIPRLRERLQDILPRHSFFNDFEVIHSFPTIGRRTMLLSSRPLESENERELILVAIEDVTERLESRTAMKRSELRYRRLFEAAKDGVLMLDPISRKITDANPFITQLLGYPHAELLGKELWEIGLLKDEPASHAAFRELQNAGFIRYEDLPLQTKTGEKREVEFVSSLYDEDGRQVIQCNIRDITARKQAEDAVIEAKNRLADQASELERLVAERTAKLRETVGELEGFSYSVAHDMRAPLRGMQGFARLLLDQHSGQLDAEAHSYLERIASSASRMDSLILDVLNYTHVLRSEALLVPVDLDHLVRDMIAIYPGWQSPKVEIEIKGTLPWVLGHEGFLTQCVSNLLSNAVKFVAPGVTPHVRIWAEDRAPSLSQKPWSTDAGNISPGWDGASIIRVWFENNGIGIAPKDHDRVFRMFDRINPAEQFEGTGIGLTIVRKAIERMGGRVGFEAKSAVGSQFWIELKQASSPSVASPEST